MLPPLAWEKSHCKEALLVLEDDARGRELPVALAHHWGDAAAPASTASQNSFLKEKIGTRGMSVGDALVATGGMLACSLLVQD